jgi:predicted ATPase/class 3 adenylate cyclase/predicted negative regulator of RcsB-dependent stress response
MITPPSGIVTFLFTDIEGSTKLAQEYHDMLEELLQKHDAIIRNSTESHHGHVFRIIGDAFCCAFENASDALNAALQAQLLLASEDWGGAEIRVRIGIHSGMAEWSGSEYMGYLTLARTNRVMSSAHGGQIIVSADVVRTLEDHIKDSMKLPVKNMPGKFITFRSLGERRLKDLIEPIELFQIYADGLEDEFPPLKTLDLRQNNLPVQLTSFVGRTVELKEISRILPETRLLTVVGPGGTGKTRLMMQAAADLIDEFANGVWLAELASVYDPSLLYGEIMKTLGIPEQPGKDLEESTLEYLKDKQMLILLDNCEHLVEACSVFAEKVLKNCQGLKIIATSREALQCQGERVLSLTSLDHPGPEEILSPEELVKFEAVRLFIERALLVSSAFRVNQANAGTLQKICWQLDGIPLALELAAVRLRVLSLEMIYRKLNDRFRLLTGGNRTALPRQQTLKAMIDWSYDLLNEKEKLLFGRLSVFKGGWTIEAAEQICSDEHLDTYEIMDILTDLLDKSLITSKEERGIMRFGMLESIRQYAKDMAGDVSSIKEKHSEYFRKIADATEILEGRSDITAWAETIDVEAPNIKRAIFRSLPHHQERAVEVLNNLCEYWVLRGHYSEGYIMCRKVLELDELNDPVQKGMALYAMGHMSSIIGNMQECRKLGKESLALLRSAGNKFGIANACNLVGLSLSNSMKLDNEAWEHFEEALSLFSELGLRHHKASVLYNMSFVAAKKSDRELSLKLKEEALEIYRETKNPTRIALTLTALGSVELKSGNIEKAREHIEEALTLAERTKDKYLTSINLVLLGCINSDKGDYETAQKYFAESLNISKQCGYVANIIPTLYHAGDAYLKSGDLVNAGKSYAESVKTGAEKEIDFYFVHNMIGLGLMYYAKEDFRKSLAILLMAKKVLNGTYGTVGKQKADEAEEHITRIESMLGASECELIRKSIEDLSEADMIGSMIKDID